MYSLTVKYSLFSLEDLGDKGVNFALRAILAVDLNLWTYYQAHLFGKGVL